MLDRRWRRHRTSSGSTRLACLENTLKLTPSAKTVAPSGKLRPAWSMRSQGSRELLAGEDFGRSRHAALRGHLRTRSVLGSIPKDGAFAAAKDEAGRSHKVIADIHTESAILG